MFPPQNKKENNSIWFEVTSSLVETSFDKFIFAGDRKCTTSSLLLSKFIKEEHQEPCDSPPFFELFVNKLVDRIVPEGVPQRETFVKESGLDNRNEFRNIVSTTNVVNNMKELGLRLDRVYDLQDKLIRIVTWRKNSKTVLFLIILSLFSLNSRILFVYIPLILMLIHSLSQYNKLYPPKLKIFNGKNSRCIGKSLLNNLYFEETLLDQQSIETFLFPGEKNYNNNNSDCNNNFYYGVDDNSTPYKSQVEFIIGLRDFQDFTTEILNIIDIFEKFIDKLTSFKNEFISTVFFVLLMFFVILCYKLIPNTFQIGIFLKITIFLLIIFNHPYLKTFIICNKKAYN